MQSACISAEEGTEVCRNEISIGISDYILIPTPQKWALLEFCTSAWHRLHFELGLPVWNCFQTSDSRGAFSQSQVCVFCVKKCSLLGGLMLWFFAFVVPKYRSTLAGYPVRLMSLVWLTSSFTMSNEWNRKLCFFVLLSKEAQSLPKIAPDYVFSGSFSLLLFYYIKCNLFFPFGFLSIFVPWNFKH